MSAARGLRRFAATTAVLSGLLLVWAGAPSCTSSNRGPLRRPDAGRTESAPGPASGARTPARGSEASGGGGGRGCLDCHGDVAETLAVEDAHFDGMAARCEDCHDRHGLVGVLKLKKAEPQLCLDCHADSRAYLEAEHPHGALADGKCSSCHLPHSSSGPKLLRAQGAELCFQCHDAEAYRGVESHGPVGQDCSKCHDPHVNATAEGLVRAVPALCTDCHAPETGVLAKVHEGYDVSGSNCSDCHAPHDAAGAGLLHQVVHDPFGQRDCAVCHVEPDEVPAGARVPDTLAPGDAMCAICHGDTVSHIQESSSPHGPAAEGRCTECHAVHASPHESLLVAAAGESLCVRCHEPQAEAQRHASAGWTPHTPVARGQCLSCHDAHGGAEEPVLKATGSELCLSCHQDVEQHLGRDVVHAPLEDCTLCHAGHGSTTPGLLKGNPETLCVVCHGDLGERMQREEVHRPVSLGQCMVCHDGHASDLPGLLRRPVEQLCVDCHAEVVEPPSGSSMHQPVGAGECLACHDPHTSRHDVLLKEAPEALCVSCHGLTHQRIEGAEVRHAPAEAGACLACHEAHHAPREQLLSADGADLCRTCHVEVFDEALRPGHVAHQPVLDGECLLCHEAHASDHAGLVRQSSPRLCSVCHDLDGAELNAKHLGLLGPESDCLACHTPHAAPGAGLIWPNRHPPFAEQSCDECH